MHKSYVSRTAKGRLPRSLLGRFGRLATGFSVLIWFAERDGPQRGGRAGAPKEGVLCRGRDPEVHTVSSLVRDPVKG